MRALFGRKVTGLEELREITEAATEQGQQGQLYTITREVILEDKDFKVFSKDFFEDQLWITREDGGVNEAGEIRCIRVVNKDTKETVLVNSEGYGYPRYTGLEPNGGEVHEA